ncbi:universal stress protein [Streptomyces sp. NBC_00335]|uniref:universal stress protein n=1 Tax=unclassified Streptomyces TaxID=2593676 RepID=UPI00225B4D63|nr:MULTISPECIES: universal stress protein [unclassified Streptomyces]MCX5403267.1 universal stress protein [Streptomyces sp. NBC_00086]
MQTNSAGPAPASSRPVLAAVDGSEHSLRTLDWALDTARTRGADLHVAHVRPEALRVHAPGEALVPPHDRDTDPVLDAVRARLAGREDLPPVTYVSRDGTPSATLTELAAGAQLLVMGSRGLGGFASLLLGSNSRVCAAQSPCPVVVVPHTARLVTQEAGARAPGGERRVVLGLAPDETAEDVVDFAFAEARRRGAVLQVVSTHLVPLSSLTLVGSLVAERGGGYPPGTAGGEATETARELAENQRTRLQPYLTRHYPDVTVEAVVAPGDPAGRLVTASQRADLIVVGRHRRRLRADSLLMGSVSTAVLLHALCPVAVVPARG